MVTERKSRWALQWTHIATGIRGLQAPLRLEIRTRHHDFRTVDFLMDSGAKVTSISAAAARDWHIPFSQKAIELELRTVLGRVRQRVHPGQITVRIPGLEGREFTWPCHFVEHKGSPPPQVLGLAGILQDLRIIFDGAHTQDAPYGCLILEELMRTT